MIFSSVSREHILGEMASRTYDLLIMGGGITGAGIALDAAVRGIRTALIEMNDFASGTSGRSTKLVHGGLRYLQNGEIKEVAELGKERAIVYQNGPHVTTPIWMLLPIHKGGPFGKWSTKAGLTLYDILARVQKEERKKMLTAREALAEEPLLKEDGLLGAGKYVEYRTDDARLTIEVMKTSAQKGADVINYVKMESFIYNHENKISGVRAKDQLNNRILDIKAKTVINASGPWVDDVRSIDRAIDQNKKQLKLSKGIHLVFDQLKFPLRHAVYFDAPDGRLIFAIPRDNKTYVGTTDTFYNGDPAIPKAGEEDRGYLLSCIRHFFPEIKLTMEDIESSWAGVRPLISEEGKSASEISRKDEIWESASGLITIAGGKLTGYRKMAERAVNIAVKRLKALGHGPYGPGSTKTCTLSGGDMNDLDQLITHYEQKSGAFGLSQQEGRYIASKYGSNAGVLFNWALEAGSASDRLLYAEVMYALYDEMAVSPSDFFIRRTGDLYFNIQRVYTSKDLAIKWMGQALGWSEEEKRAYDAELIKYVNEAAGKA